MPEHVWGGDGIYPGFPANIGPDILQAASTNIGDSGSLTVYYLPSFTASAYLTASVTLSGSEWVDFPVSAVRTHSAFYDNGDPVGFNLGDITIRHKNNTGSIFTYVSSGSNQSYDACYTIPSGSTGYLCEFFCNMQDGNAGSTLNGTLWLREYGKSPRLRRNFVSAQGSSFIEDIEGAFVIPPLTDIQIRILNVSHNTTLVVGGYTLLLIQNK